MSALGTPVLNQLIQFEPLLSEETLAFIEVLIIFLRIEEGGADLSILSNDVWLGFTLLCLCEAFPGCGWTFQEPTVYMEPEGMNDLVGQLVS